jgi:hypothetical protein
MGLIVLGRGAPISMASRARSPEEAHTQLAARATLG